MQTAKAWPIDPLGLGNVQLEVAAKVTTGISGLKQPNVHRDVVFGSFEVGSSYPSGARLILLFNTNANCEGMAYGSFWSEKCSARGGSQKLAQG